MTTLQFILVLYVALTVGATIGCGIRPKSIKNFDQAARQTMRSRAVIKSMNS